MIALPLTTKLIGGLAIALALSLGGNVLQLRSAWVGEGEAKGEAQRQTLSATNQALEQDQAVQQALAKQAKTDNAELLASVQGIAASVDQGHTSYRAAATKAPLAANCAPGKGRMDSVNTTLGPLKGAP